MKTISVIMAAFNSGPILEKCLESIRQQNYEQDKTEIIVADFIFEQRYKSLAKIIDIGLIFLKLF